MLSVKDIKFEFDKKIIEKLYSSKYFINTQKILEDNNLGDNVTLRFSHFNNNTYICGIHEVISLLKFSIPKKYHKDIKIYYLEDGSLTNKLDPILIIEGNYKYFGHLENVIDSILSRRTSVYNNCKQIIETIGCERFIFMSDRNDDYSLQQYDGYCAYLAGVKKFVTDSQINLFKEDNEISVLGTIPHALIQQFEGNLLNALLAYQKSFPNNFITALIDYHNDVVSEIKNLKENNFKKLDFVRIDTSKSLVDISLQKEYKNWKDDKSLYGVNPTLIKLVKKTLLSNGFDKTKIIISSGIDLNTIKEYEKQNLPIDIYGVGKFCTTLTTFYTGDIIKTNNVYEAKVGRNENIDHQIKKMNCIHLNEY